MKRVQVKTRPRTMSGYRGNFVLTLDACEAQRWIERGWADPVEQEEPETKPAKRKGAA